MWDGSPFSGTKIAAFCGNKIVAYLRDDKEGIPFAGRWDLPGGGREGNETPIQCALRELEEEFGIRVSEQRIKVLERHPSLAPAALDTYFCVARISQEEVEQIKFGNEGQQWQMMMSATEFVIHALVAPPIRERLKPHLKEDN